MLKTFGRSVARIAAIAICLGALAGAVWGFQGYCGPIHNTRGDNSTCTAVGECGWYTWCIVVNCKVNGEQIARGCFPPGYYMGCNFGGCANPFTGNCSGC